MRLAMRPSAGALTRSLLLVAAAAALSLPLAAAPPVRLTYVPGSTAKLEQLVGDYDKERKAPTATRSLSRYGIEGTDLGYSFEHDGRLYFLFGDTVGRDGGDVIGTSDATDPEHGLHLDFLTEHDGRYLRVAPPGIEMKGFDVPVSGISLGGHLFVVVKTGHTRGAATDRSVLTELDLGTGAFKVLRTISRLPAGRVIKMSMHEQMGPIAGLPPGGPYVLIWSSGVYRSSNAYLSVVPAATFESGEGTRYFAGLKGSRPTWSERESEAAPIVEHPTIGDLSVTWAPALHLWLMTYDSRDPRGVVFRYSATPWGPWSDLQIIFKVARDGSGFIHRKGRDDGLAGPVIGRGKANPEGVAGGAYAPYAIERFTRLDGDTLSLYYVLSTWNPYVVVLMRSQFEVDTSGG